MPGAPLKLEHADDYGFTGCAAAVHARLMMGMGSPTVAVTRSDPFFQFDNAEALRGWWIMLH
jgi:hypothetical protein